MRTVVESSAWQTSPIRFFILDLSLVAGVDMSAAEAFVRIQRLLSSKGVTLVFCGFSDVSPIGRALRSVDLLEMDGVELFADFNDALECKARTCPLFLSDTDKILQGQKMLT
jgi:sulfate permease, SulP family